MRGDWDIHTGRRNHFAYQNRIHLLYGLFGFILVIWLMVNHILVLNFSDIWSFRLYGQLNQDKTVDHISKTRCRSKQYLTVMKEESHGNFMHGSFCDSGKTGIAKTVTLINYSLQVPYLEPYYLCAISDLETWGTVQSDLTWHFWRVKVALKCRIVAYTVWRPLNLYGFFLSEVPVTNLAAL